MTPLRRAFNRCVVVVFVVVAMNTIEDALAFISADENAYEYLTRALVEPLTSGVAFIDARHPEPALKPGEILEIVGAGGTGKTELALEIATTAVLPKERRGVRYRGSRAKVIVIDCDGKFDQLRLLRVLNAKISSALRVVPENKREALADEVYEESMSRFTLIRAYGSLDVLKTLTALDAAWSGRGGAAGARFCDARTTHTTSMGDVEGDINIDTDVGGDDAARGTDQAPNQRLVICDNVAAFYWLDRASRKDHGAPFNIQRVFTSEARLFKRLARAHRAAIVVTKTTTGDQRGRGEYRDFLPVEWTDAVTQRILLEPSREDSATYGEYVGIARWDTPRRPGGTFTVSELGMRC